jgi:hypothetical protein
VNDTRDSQNPGPPSRPGFLAEERVRVRQPHAVYGRRRAVLGAGVVGVAAGLFGGARALANALVGDDTLTATGLGGPATTAGVVDDPYRQAGWIKRENELEGTNDWVVTEDRSAWDKVRGYADATSINREGTLTLFTSTEASSYTAQAYRIGYYGALGGRLIWESGELAGVEQGAAEVTTSTGMREARWEPSIELPVARDWPPGNYIVKLTSSDGGESYVPFMIRDDESPAPLIVQSSVTTWQAYNEWGGASLYFGPDGDGARRAKVVSFDRPYYRSGAGEFFGREFELVTHIERLGLDVTYWTDIDLHEQPELVKNYRGVITQGHDEYYSTTMRYGLEDARDAGVNLAFFGANCAYRKIRLEDSPVGPNRREVNYRVSADDPLYGEDDEQVTSEWRNGPDPDPESSLIGNYYEANPVEADMVVGDPTHWVWADTGVEEGTVLEGVVGNEYDRVTLEVPTPDNIQVIAHSPVTCKGIPSYADVTYYSHGSGAGVFASGTLWWIRDHLLYDDVNEGVPYVLQKATENILRTFAEGPAGDEHPSENNLSEFDIAAGYISPVPK